MLGTWSVGFFHDLPGLPLRHPCRRHSLKNDIRRCDRYGDAHGGQDYAKARPQAPTAASRVRPHSFVLMRVRGTFIAHPVSTPEAREHWGPQEVRKHIARCRRVVERVMSMFTPRASIRPKPLPFSRPLPGVTESTEFPRLHRHRRAGALRGIGGPTWLN